MKFKTVYKVRIVYKSGYTYDFEVYSFTITKGEYNWEPVHPHNRPIMLGASDIAAVYQIGAREKFFFKD